MNKISWDRPKVTHSLFPSTETFFALGIFALLSLSSQVLPNTYAGEPACHILVCCKDCNKGVKFLVNGQWEEKHSYAEIDTVRDIMQKIKDAGINTVIIDMTNRPQWLSAFEPFYKERINNVEKVCGEKDMKFFIHIGHAWSEGANRDLGLPADTDYTEAWGVIAERIWDLWAQKPTYKKYGYGDERPILLTFQAGHSFWPRYNALSNKRGYPKFRIGTMRVNVPKPLQESDGWGYRNSIGNPSGTVRYTSPLGGLSPGPLIAPGDFQSELKWVRGATHYSVYGSYDDTCDGIMWGIADTSESSAKKHEYPSRNPRSFYDIVQNELNPAGSPSVSFEAPRDEQKFSVGSDVYVKVNASDDESISSVKLFLNNTPLPLDKRAPYEWGQPGSGDFALRGMPAGTYTLEAMATDNMGKTKRTYVIFKVGDR